MMSTLNKVPIILLGIMWLLLPVLRASNNGEEERKPNHEPKPTGKPSPPTISGADIVYLNGTVITMNGTDYIAEAVAVEGGKIKAVGTTEEIQALIGDNTQVVDLEGKTMLPGFIDSHSHFCMAGDLAMYTIDLTGPPVGTVKRIDDIIERLTAEVETTPKGEWIVGSGYDDTLLAENRHPTRYDLDQVSTEHPVFAWHSSYHFATVNSLGLEIAGITKDTPQPAGGVIRKDPDTGEPTGVLEEVSAYGQVYIHAMTRTPEEGVAAVNAMAQVYTSQGVTTAQQGAASTIAVNSLLEAEKRGLLPIRVVVWPIADFIQSITTGDIKENLKSAEMVSVGAAKLFSDGSIQGYTGYLTKPYYVPPGDDPEYRGYPTQDREALADSVTALHQEGFQIAIHANGDAAIDDVLYAFSEAQKAFPRDDPRHICVHCQMAREDQLDTMKELGVIPTFFSLHPYYWGDRHRDIFLGPERAFRIDPAKSAIDRGIPFTMHTDTPVVPMEPLRLVWCAVNRVSASGKVIGEEQRIPPLEALKSITINSAYQNFEEAIKGSIEPGKLADLVILSENPITVDPMAIVDIEVEETIVGGETVFKKPSGGQWE